MQANNSKQKGCAVSKKKACLDDKNWAGRQVSGPPAVPVIYTDHIESCN